VNKGRLPSISLALAVCTVAANSALAAPTTPAVPTADPLLAGFIKPPPAARPRVWWHWMNGNISKAGIKLDLEWMQRTGIGGFQNFDAALMTPQVVDKRLVFMTPEWRDAFHYAISLADELGLEAAIAGSPGWSESGGPWVEPEQAMKKVVWSETTVAGGRPYTGQLAPPPAVSGPFQDAPLVDMMAPPGAAPTPQHYRDTLVLAYRQPEAEAQPLAARAQVTSSGGHIDAALLGDGAIAQAVSLPIAPVGAVAWIRFEFGQPETVRALTFARTDHVFLEEFLGGPPGPEFEASDDGVTWRSIASVPADPGAEHTISFTPVTARYFRAAFRTAAPESKLPPGFDPAVLGINLPPPPTDYHISELRLEAAARLNRFEEKAGFALTPDATAIATPPATPESIIERSSVVDLSARLRPDGTLDWTPPPGRWTVLRMGYSLTGVTNHPASPEGTGLEVDKLSGPDVRAYMAHYLDLYQDFMGPLMGQRGLKYLVSDSWEAGAQNWTDAMLAEFRGRRGYDAVPWLPVLTGRVVESVAASERFLWDYRRTLADLLAENHYDQITALLHARGMGHYGESHESGRAFIGDGMEVKRSDDVPMAAMWTQFPGVNNDQPGYNADLRESASVAHLYGQNLVAAESMTAGVGAWRWSPATLKPTADKELAMGLNRFVIHTSVHQPLVDKAPGLSLGPFGQWFTRNETWSGEGARAWVDYLARSSFMLQQGRFVADIAWFYGEDSNITALYGKAAPPIPAGYNFDYVNADALRHRLSARAGRIVTPSGMQYQLLALDPRSVHMSLPVLKAIRRLVSAGAVVSGARPTDSPSLADDQREFRTIVQSMWGDGAAGAHRFGKGSVYCGLDPEAVLRALNVPPDFEYSKPSADTQLLAVHRRLADGDLYFVDNRQERAESIEATFRVHGRRPELWHADTGRIEAAAWHRVGNRTAVSLTLGPWDAVFVVFRKPTQATSGVLPAHRSDPAVTLDGPWTVQFQPGRGAPASASVNALGSWSDSADPGVKYFSGTGTYLKSLEVPAEWLTPGSRLWLDLGAVHELATVSVNGHRLGILWRPPYRIDIAPALHAGSNALEIAVTDLWVNRLIGDAQPGATERYTFTVPSFYKADSPLVPAGLIGPVQVELSRVDRPTRQVAANSRRLRHEAGSTQEIQARSQR
jgi:hypothetical protein